MRTCKQRAHGPAHTTTGLMAPSPNQARDLLHQRGNEKMGHLLGPQFTLESRADLPEWSMDLYDLPRRPGAAGWQGTPACPTEQQWVGRGGSDPAGASCQLLTQRHSRQAERRASLGSGLIRLLLWKSKTPRQRVRTAHLGGKRANCESASGPREERPESRMRFWSSG